jgi:hypothetical protein
VKLQARRGERVAGQDAGHRGESAGEPHGIGTGDQAEPLAGGEIGAHHLYERRREPRRVAPLRQVDEAQDRD